MKITFLLSLSAFLLGVGCTTTEPPVLEAQKYRTFSIAPLPTKSPASDPDAAARLNGVLTSAIREALTSKGYTEDASGNGDFLVQVHTEFYGDFELATTGAEQRVLSISFSDTRNGVEIWRASQGRSSSHTLEADSIRKAVLDIFAPIPAASAAR